MLSLLISNVDCGMAFPELRQQHGPKLLIEGYHYALEGQQSVCNYHSLSIKAQRVWLQNDKVLICTIRFLLVHKDDMLTDVLPLVMPILTFANQAGLDMLETTLVELQDISLEKILDENGRKGLCSEFPQIIQQGFACLQGGICVSSLGKAVSYERAVAWKVVNEENHVHCICFMFINWSFV
ncbi:hypothetical protein SSX86_030448 [Deinandra increscens subsp. villosa]|uniref:MEKHLA domain-containing protein n=1 Tax=Deinandra increscens subsp. villosa TaxID=3103831 RepID=A0AAP0CAQ8_9ASTR